MRPTQAPHAALEALRSGAVDVVAFGSPSAVRNVLALLGSALPADVAVACIGPITAAEARRLGCRVDVVAEEYSMPGLVDAMVRFVETGKLERERGG